MSSSGTQSRTQFDHRQKQNWREGGHKNVKLAKGWLRPGPLLRIEKIFTCAIAHLTIGPQAILARLTFSNV